MPGCIKTIINWIVIFALVATVIYIREHYKSGKAHNTADELTSYVFATKKDLRSIEDVLKSVVTIYSSSGNGSGFVVASGKSSHGIVLTNHHVVRNEPEVRVRRIDGKEFKGIVFARNSKRDVAAIFVPNLSLPPITIRKDFPKITEEVFAIGSPSRLSGTVTKGIVSAWRKMDGQIWIQGDVAVNPGNSGGPLVDARGNVVGISTSVMKDAQGISFFAPIMDALKQVTDESDRSRDKLKRYILDYR